MQSPEVSDADLSRLGHVPQVHVGAVRQLRDQAMSRGLAPELFLDPALIALIANGDAPQYLPSIVLIDALEAAATRLGNETLALEISETADMHGFGPLSSLTGQCYSVEDALMQSERYMHLANGALATRIERYGDAVRVERFCIVPGSRGNRQTMDAAIVLLVRAMRGVLGQDWAPRLVELGHGGAACRATYRRVFRAKLAFDAGHYAVELALADFTRQVTQTQSAQRLACDRDLADSDLAHPADFIVLVSQKVRQSLAEGTVSLAGVAASMGQPARSFQRRLHRLGVDYSDILRQQRTLIADEYLKSQRQPNLAELADRLAFQDATAVSRFMRLHMGRGMASPAVQVSRAETARA